MTLPQILTELESLGDPARRKHNAKAGAPDDQFGVKLGDFRAVAKRIKADHAVSLELWDSGNIDAPFLAAPLITPRRRPGAPRRTVRRALDSDAIATINEQAAPVIGRGL